jgi:hypothetical protein
MTTRRHTKLLHEGSYVAELDIDLVESDLPWSPYISVEDARRLDEVRDALRRADLDRALKLARVYRPTPVER